MAEASQTLSDPTPEEERAIVLEKVREILRYAVIDTEEGVKLDLDQLTRLLLQRAVPYRTLNREISWMELNMVREEQNTQKVRADQGNEEGARRLEALKLREQLILDQLWPIQRRLNGPR